MVPEMMSFKLLQFAVQRFVGLDDLLAVIVKHLASRVSRNFFLLRSMSSDLRRAPAN